MLAFPCYVGSTWLCSRHAAWECQEWFSQHLCDEEEPCFQCCSHFPSSNAEKHDWAVQRRGRFSQIASSVHFLAVPDFVVLFGCWHWSLLMCNDLITWVPFCISTLACVVAKTITCHCKTKSHEQGHCFSFCHCSETLISQNEILRFVSTTVFVHVWILV